jgi:hypothetical protein
MSGKDAVTRIKKERLDLRQVIAIPNNSMVTMDYRTDRVRVFVDSEGKVSRPPRVG